MSDNLEKYYLELLLIAEKNKIDEYVKNTESYGTYSDTDEGICLDCSFEWEYSPEGWYFWEDIFLEANFIYDRKINTCPFCGGEGEDSYYGEWRYVQCIDCGAKGSRFSVAAFPEVAKERARFVWNKRS